MATARLTLASAEGFVRGAEGLLYGIIALLYVGSLAAAVFLRAGRYLRAVAYGQLAGDLLAATGLVYLTGGAESIFTILYPLAIVNGAIGLSRPGASIAAASSAVLFGAMVLLTEQGVVPLPAWLARPPLPVSRLLLTLAANLSAFLLTAALSGYLADALQGARKQLQKTETELVQLSAIHESIVRSIVTGILTIDGALRITYLNPAGEEICGRRLREVRGARLEDQIPDFAEALRRSQPGRGELRLRRADGGVRVIGYSQSPLVESASGSLPGQVVVFQDLTTLRQMEEAVRRADRMAAVGKLAAGLAHEIRNPLASMTGSVQLLAAALTLEDKDRRLMQIVLREGERLEALVKDFLTFARPAQPALADLQLSRLAEEVLALFGPTAKAGGLSVQAEVEPEVRARGDEGQLRQVLWNLLGNAAEATPSGGRVRVRVARRPGDALLEVEDSGAGIAAEELTRIFDPFFTTKARGSGLGLAIVHRIVEAHGGRMEVHSVPGAGSTFTVVLPAA